MRNIRQVLDRGKAVRGGSTSSLMWRKFRRHRLAVFGGAVVLLMYLTIAFAEFFAPYPMDKYHMTQTYAPPQRVYFFDSEGNFYLRPFFYARERVLDQRNFTYSYEERRDSRYPLYFFVRGDPYTLFGVFRTNVHLFGNPELPIFLLGTDEFGRDFFSRIIFAARISLTVGLLGVLLSVTLGVLLGGISGFYGGKVDNVVQRIVEITLSLPQLPLYLALSAAFPRDWSSVRVFFFMIIILSIINWGNLARQLRGKILVIRETDYVSSARALGERDFFILLRHVIPNTLSHIIAVATLAIPGIILAESTLSFLGVGIQPPMISLGVLLNKAQNISIIQNYPWMMIPGVVIIIAVLAFNFLGDGLRDAADPYTQN